ncbi:hypothetical protein FQN55_008241 [Onygenales sp. PD_40]|nr:hypothetical protein FQN55_008241 [Onygenales sp. PD_40]
MSLSRPFLLAATVVLALLLAMAEALGQSHLEYSTVPGYFLQDDPATDPAEFDYTSAFGLINQTYDTDCDFDPDNKKTQWQRFDHKLQSLNRHAPHTKYKLLYMGRHGEGYHNVAEQFYGTELWDCHWSLLDGNGTSNWADAHLTDKGIGQAQVARDTWIAQMKNHIPLPESYYVSPLDRCLQTANATFSELELPRNQAFKPVVKELLRETLGIHTCDRRSSKSYIHTTYPSYRFEPHFAEEDPLWDAELRESNSARNARLKQLLDDIFRHDWNKNTYISLTAHSGAITSILEVVGHREFGLSTGGVIPVLVRVERKKGPEPEREIEPPSTAPECEGEVERRLRN